jgi:SAM-dependent methyltransferase
LSIQKKQNATSHSSLAGVGLYQKTREAIAFVKMKFQSFKGSAPESFNYIFDELASYRSIYERFSGRSFEGANVLEIGFGARPLKLMAHMSIGIDIRGIDLDMPMLKFSPRRLFQILRRNGLEPAIKTAARSMLFDWRERNTLKAALRRRGYEFRIQREGFLIGDAATFDYGERSIDFVYSESVFEHIPEQSIEKVMERIAKILSPDGIAVITPDIFTGITGGHLVEWYGYTISQDFPRKSEPWEHLRKQRFTANTYLNRLTRSDYRRIFGQHFEILEENELRPDMGRRWLTAAVKADLPQWSEEDLLSNRVQFVLRLRADRK